jgi:hypothetical protein
MYYDLQNKQESQTVFNGSLCQLLFEPRWSDSHLCLKSQRRNTNRSKGLNIQKIRLHGMDSSGYEQFVNLQVDIARQGVIRVLPLGECTQRIVCKARTYGRMRVLDPKRRNTCYFHPLSLVQDTCAYVCMCVCVYAGCTDAHVSATCKGQTDRHSRQGRYHACIMQSQVARNMCQTII